MNPKPLYWFAVIKTVRALCAIGLTGAAEWVAEVSGLKARLKTLLEVNP